MLRFIKIILIVLFSQICLRATAWPGMPMPRLHVEGRYLKDPQGNIVNLHGFAQTFSPWFNERGTKWSNYDVNACLSYNKGIIDGIMARNWKVNFVRQHMDPYWSSTPGCEGRYEGEECFDETRFRKYLDEVFVPMAEYAVSKGLYVVLRPPGVCPEEIAVGDVYQNYLIKVWSIVAKHPRLRNHPNIMFELANEPVRILGPDGSYGSGSQGHFNNLKTYFQTITDTIRATAGNILWIPGLGWQSQYKGFAVNPIEGEDIGYAVHIYPGWFNSGDGYEPFQAGWDENVKPVADFAPIMVTEMDWAPEKYDASWGKGITGTAGGAGFGANFKKITDESGNVSWLFFTEPHWLTQFTGTPPAAGQPFTFLNDPEACPWPIFHWFQDYATREIPRPDFTYRSHSDNGNGTFTNPVIFGDFPDPDVIRVGDWYYMASTSGHIAPGATLLQSRDLVNWRYSRNVTLELDNDCYRLDGCHRYDEEQTVSLIFRNGTFYLLFSTSDAGNYLLTSTDPQGAWEQRKLNAQWEDASLFFDDNGKKYVVFGNGQLRIAEVNQDFEMVVGTEQVAFTQAGLRGASLHKIDGKYYLFATYPGAFQVALRSDEIFGSYEEKKLLESSNIQHGTLVQTQTGQWWTMLSYTGGAFGRLPHLQPVSWAGGWPEIAASEEAFATFDKPDVGREHHVISLATNDNFRGYQLSPQWGWNHQPDHSNWSLLERPGHLRLKTANVTNDFLSAKNTLTQRIFGYPDDLENSYGTVKLEVKNMQEGDVAGLAVLQDPYAYVGVKAADGARRLVVFQNGVEQVGPVFTDSIVFLRIIANYATSQASFYYSLDNESYVRLGSDFQLTDELGMMAGSRFGLFNFATSQTGGFVDVDWFSTEPVFTESRFYDNNFVGYSEESLTLVDLQLDNEQLYLLTGSISSIQVSAVFADGRTENVSIGASYSNYDTDVIQVFNGRVMTLKDGETVVTVSYEGPLGHRVSKEVRLVASTFPLVSGLFDPSIWETGTFEEATRTVRTGQWGFAGWQYDGIDLSAYKHLVVRLGSANTADVQFRIFDGSSYWGSPANFPFTGTQEVVVNLRNATKDDGTLLDPSHIYIVGFWSNGSNPFVIDTVFLSNSREYDPPTVLAQSTTGSTVQQLAGFSYLLGEGPSASQMVVVSGYNLGSQMTVNASADFEISLRETEGFASSLTLNAEAGEVLETSIYVRMKADLGKTQVTGQLTLASSGAATITVNLSGTVQGILSADDALASKKVLFVEYFTLSGQRLQHIEGRSGLFIIREFYSDGSVGVKKVLQRE